MERQLWHDCGGAAALAVMPNITAGRALALVISAVPTCTGISLRLASRSLALKSVRQPGLGRGVCECDVASRGTSTVLRDGRRAARTRILPFSRLDTSPTCKGIDALLVLLHVPPHHRPRLQVSSV